jgi:hypothetical protein
MSAENLTLQMLEYEASAYGEIHSMDTDSIEIRGNFTPGQSLVIRPGAKVFVLTADNAIKVLDSHAAERIAVAVDEAVEAAIETERAAVKARAEAAEKAKAGAARK